MTVPCPECGFDWDLDEPAIVACIAAAATNLRAAIGDPARPGLGERSRPELWSPLEYVAHTGDALGWYGVRIHRILEGSGRLVAGPDWDGLVSSHIVAGWSAQDALAFVGGVAGPLGALLDDLEADGWRSTGTTLEGARRSVVELARRAAHEVQHHAFDVRRLLQT